MDVWSIKSKAPTNAVIYFAGVAIEAQRRRKTFLCFSDFVIFCWRMRASHKSRDGHGPNTRLALRNLALVVRGLLSYALRPLKFPSPTPAVGSTAVLVSDHRPRGLPVKLALFSKVLSRAARVVPPAV